VVLVINDNYYELMFALSYICTIHSSSILVPFVSVKDGSEEYKVMVKMLKGCDPSNGNACEI
jgi:hypothetical protein